MLRVRLYCDYRIEQGIEKGIEKVALNMRLAGIGIDIIMLATGLSLDNIAGLKA